jgi:hypothetical protein
MLNEIQIPEIMVILDDYGVNGVLYNAKHVFHAIAYLTYIGLLNLSTLSWRFL